MLLSDLCLTPTVRQHIRNRRHRLQFGNNVKPLSLTLWVFKDDDCSFAARFKFDFIHRTPVALPTFKVQSNGIMGSFGGNAADENAFAKRNLFNADLGRVQALSFTFLFYCSEI